MTEFEIAGVLDDRIGAAGGVPVVTLVAADARVEKYRHPIPTSPKVNRYCMLVTCGIRRIDFKHDAVRKFRSAAGGIEEKQQAVCNVDAAIDLSTRPGKTLGEMFAVIDKAYSDNGFAGEVMNHHQGGSTGYAGREAFAEPGSGIAVMNRQAFAWNPSIAGVKSEDTVLCTQNGVEMLTTISDHWPK